MAARTVFFRDDRSLRAGWRIVVFLAASVVATVIAFGTVGPLISGLFTLLGMRGVDVASWIEVAGLLAATAFTLRFVDRRPWRDVWLDRTAARGAVIATGFVIGVLAIALPITLLIGTRWLREASGPRGSWWGAALRVTLVLLPAALSEELLTRGYILSVLRDSWGWAWALGTTSVAFGLLHLRNNGADLRPVLLVSAAGIFLGVIVWATRSLYAAWAAHFAWNWTMAVLFHAAVSGIALEAPRYRYVDAGPDWATGGVWGPEGGLPAGLGMAAGVAYLISQRKRRSSIFTSEN